MKLTKDTLLHALDHLRPWRDLTPASIWTVIALGDSCETCNGTKKVTETGRLWIDCPAGDGGMEDEDAVLACSQTECLQTSTCRNCHTNPLTGLKPKVKVQAGVDRIRTCPTCEGEGRVNLRLRVTGPGGVVFEGRDVATCVAQVESSGLLIDPNAALHLGMDFVRIANLYNFGH